MLSSSPQPPEITHGWRMPRLPFFFVSLICVPLIWCFTLVAISQFEATNLFFNGYSLFLLILTAVYSVAIAGRFRDFGLSGFWTLLPVSFIILLFVASAARNGPLFLFACGTSLIVFPIIILFIMLFKGNESSNTKQGGLEANVAAVDTETMKFKK